MGVIVFADQQSADAAIAEIHSTPWIAGGSGPVKLGSPLRGGDGRMAIAHHFHEADLDWLVAHTAGMSAEAAEELPPDWEWL
jgi:hypothetical protein